MYFHYIDLLEVIDGKHFVRGYRSRFSFFFFCSSKNDTQGGHLRWSKGGPQGSPAGGALGAPFLCIGGDIFENDDPYEQVYSMTKTRQ